MVKMTYSADIAGVLEIPTMIDTGLVVVLTITITMLISVLVLLFYDFEDWCPQVYLIIADCSVSNICIYSESNPILMTQIKIQM